MAIAFFYKPFFCDNRVFLHVMCCAKSISNEIVGPFRVTGWCSRVLGQDMNFFHNVWREAINFSHTFKGGGAGYPPKFFENVMHFSAI